MKRLSRSSPVSWWLGTAGFPQPCGTALHDSVGPRPPAPAGDAAAKVWLRTSYSCRAGSWRSLGLM